MTRTITAGPWTISIPQPCGWLTANDRGRWETARRVKTWRDAAFVASLRARPPKGLARVRVDTLFRVAGRWPVREIENLRPTLKAVVDGAIGPCRRQAAGYGIVPDDSDAHVEYGYYIAESIEHTWQHPAALPCRCSAVVLTVTDLSNQPAGLPTYAEAFTERFGSAPGRKGRGQ